MINGFEKLSLVDYPGCTACTAFYGACNFRCPFCHNAVLVLDPKSQGEVDKKEILAYLKKRVGILDGICITGGEPTLSNDLIDFIKDCKDIGLKVKLDSNGTRPEVLKYLIDNKLIDYIAMDIKNSREKYDEIAGVHVDMNAIDESIKYIMENMEDYEFRTTLVEKYHSVDDIENIAKWIKGAKHYYLQKFEDKGGCIQSGLKEVDIEIAKKMQEKALQFVDVCELRSYE